MTSASHDNDHWEDALDGIGLTEGRQQEKPTLSLLFANALYPDFDALAVEAYKRSGAQLMIGCTGRGVIGGGTEIEGRPALAILNLDLPGATLFPKHIEASDLASLASPQDLPRLLGATPDQVNAFLVLADAFTFDVEPLLAGLAAAYPGKPIAGGLASGLAFGDWTWLMLNDQAHNSGAIVLGIGGAFTLRTIVAQGAIPLGEPGIATEAQGGQLQSISGRPAADVRRAVIDELDEEFHWQAQESLLIGIPSGEGHNGVVMRDVLGADRRTGVVTVRGTIQVGQPIQFYIANPEYAGRELRSTLASAKRDIAALPNSGVLLCSALTRGIELFRIPDHDTAVIHEVLGDLSLAGFFSAGEIATTDGVPLLHGATASLTFFVKQSSS